MRFPAELYATGAAPRIPTLASSAATAPTHSGEAKIRVVVAEDNPQMRQMITHSITQTGQFEVVGSASDGAGAVTLVESLAPDVLLVDLVMPVMNGVDAIKTLRARGSNIRALVLTSNADKESVARAMEAGADGYVLKGAPAEQIRAALRDVAAGGAVLAPSVARGVVDEYARLLEEKRKRDLAVIRTLAGAVEKRDLVTGDHIHNVSTLSAALFRAMTGRDADEDMVYGFLLHDVGKIGIPDAILLKAGPLTDEEYARMRTHVEIGLELIVPLGFSDVVYDIIRCHHEKWNGSGYPNGLAGDQIPFHARLFTVVDAYDAMVADRPYRKGMTAGQAKAELQAGGGTQFDPDCVAAFAMLMDSMGPI